MTARARAPSIDVDGAHRYDGWRRRWHSGAHGQAIGMLRHHGMARALALTAKSTPPRPAFAPVGSPSDASPFSDDAVVTRAAARMIHELLVREAGEPRHA